ncbi:hypothetical protein N9B82_02230 [Saprospiraceae bacterium]|nr:hypothetical protein [Saprospiraceae bacterium]
MKIYITLLLLIPFLLQGQDGYNIASRQSSSVGQTVKIFSTGIEQMQLLKISSSKDLVLCNDNMSVGKDECQEVTGYEKILDDNLVPIRFVTAKDGRHFMLAYAKRKGEKELFKVEYDLKSNKLLNSESLGVFDSYKKSNNMHGTLRVLASENDEYFAIVEMMGTGQSITQVGRVLMNKVLLNSQLEKIYIHQSSHELTIYPSAALSKKPFVEAYWNQVKAVLTNQGDFYFLQNLFSDFALVSISSKTQKAKIQFIEKAEFNRTLPTINYQCEKGVEFWSVRKERNENEFEIKIHSSQNGEDLKERTLSIAKSASSEFEIDDDDSFFLINTITKTLIGDTYISISPTKNYPLSFTDPYKFKINGLSILKVEDELLIPVYQTRYKTKFVTEGTVQIGTIPFAWDVECNNKLLFFYADSKAKDYMYKTAFFKVNAIELDGLTGKAKPLSFEVPKKFKKVSGIYPKIYVNSRREFVVLEHGDKWSSKKFFLISPENIQKVYQM